VEDEHTLEGLLREALRDPAPPTAAVARAKGLTAGPLASAFASLAARARNLVAELALDSRQRPALAGFRGGGQGFHLLYRRDRHEVFLEVQTPVRAEDAFLLNAQIDADGVGVGECPIIVLSANSPDPIRQLVSDPEGTFKLKLPAGRYELALGVDPPLLVAGVDLA
jgi:hypothetical protein